MEFTHINELVAHSKLSEQSDSRIFINQKVEVIDDVAIRWSFTLQNGKKIYFQESIIHLKFSNFLENFKQYIRKSLLKEKPEQYENEK
ncbi:hypothetical protein QU814_05355 [Providencia rettgeri]|uniref:hypothetical protein n=1 Tax=Providencia rettgeri TaxID=587 RepID=UPI00222F541F|nr:hypothetical protein [Providencia rettgeri]MDM9282616.1 hypothetical protein [Providencia rettgeri]